MNDLVLKPQPGPQELFLSSDTEIVLYGGAAGGGKSYALLMEPLYHIANPDFGAVIFRRTYPQIMSEGGLWDTARSIYPHLGATPNQSSLTWTFPSGAAVSFSHLQYDKDVLAWQGAQLPLICMDEAVHFTGHQFWYLLSRNRTTCGVKPYVRMTCNPDPDSWLRKFIDWWIDKDGYPIAERAGVVRYFIRQDNTVHWADTSEALQARFPGSLPKSFTFIPSKVTDNQILMASDPGYLANLQAQDAVTRAQLLDGNWNAKAAAGLYFKRGYFPTLDAPPDLSGARLVRFWDMAGTEPNAENPDPDWTVGCLLAALPNNTFVVLDVKRARISPARVEQLVGQTAAEDRDSYGSITTMMEQEPGSSGKTVIDHYRRNVLRGYAFKTERPTGDKTTRSLPTSSASEGGLISIVRTPWNDAFLNELESFPEGAHDDQVDALSGAHRALTRPAASGMAAMI